MGPPAEISRDVLDAEALLGDLIGEIRAARRMWDILSPETSGDPDAPVFRRLVLVQLVALLARWLEFFTRFSTVIPPDCLPAGRTLVKELESRGVPHFRNRIAGRLWDRRRSRPLLAGQVEEELAAVTGGDGGRFVQWVSSPPADPFPETVAGVLAHVRRRIRERHGLA